MPICRGVFPPLPGARPWPLELPDAGCGASIDGYRFSTGGEGRRADRGVTPPTGTDDGRGVVPSRALRGVVMRGVGPLDPPGTWAPVLAGQGRGVTGLTGLRGVMPGAMGSSMVSPASP
jgi:hypothetical protein